MNKFFDVKKQEQWPKRNNNDPHEVKFAIFDLFIPLTIDEKVGHRCKVVIELKLNAGKINDHRIMKTQIKRYENLLFEEGEKIIYISASLQHPESEKNERKRNSMQREVSYWISYDINAVRP